MKSPVVSDSELARHLNLSADEIDGGVRAHLNSLSAGARAFIFKRTGDFSDTDTGVPADVKMAIMLLAAHWYACREAAVVDHLSAIPFGVESLIAPYEGFYFG